jgi:hypothetical protein
MNRTVSAVLVCSALLGAVASHAKEDTPAAGSESDALDLADKADAPSPQPISPLRAFLELAAGQEANPDGAYAGMGRLAFDFRYTGKLSPTVSAVLSARLDMARSRGGGYDGETNTWREAYLSWAAGPELSFDLGRVNVRNGVAVGYNPTDWFKQSAVRPILTLDPALLRENRQGTVVLQGQRVWDRGSVTFTVSPRLSTGGDDGLFSPRLRVTNPQDRWLVTGSYKVRDGLNPQILLFGGTSTPTQLGLNLTALVSDAMVAYAEMAGGDGQSLRDQAATSTASRAWQKRLATGLTYTAPNDLTLTAEWQYNSAAPKRADWQALPRDAQGTLINLASDLQDQTARQQLFVSAQWKPPSLRPLELVGFLQRDLETAGSLGWIEARFRMERTDLALQFHTFGGAAGAIYKAMPQQKGWQIIWRQYFDAAPVMNRRPTDNRG